MIRPTPEADGTTLRPADRTAPAGSRSGPIGSTPPSGLTIVLPAYNEHERLGSALDELFSFLRGWRGQDGDSDVDLGIRVLIVDDGSSDGTAALVRARPEYADPPAGLHLSLLQVVHGGKGAAVRAGVLAANRELIVFADADMATPPDQLPKLVAALRDCDVALGSRIQADGQDLRRTQPAYRRVLGRVFHVLASIWVVGPVKDTQCGFKGFRHDVARDLFARQRVTSIVFDVELIYLARRLGYRVTVVPILWSDKRGSRMRARPRLAAQVAWDLFRIPLLHRRG